MQSKIESNYVELRERILFGELPAGTSMSSEDVIQLTGVSLSMARQLLLALGSAGYLTKTGRIYSVATFTRQQVEEWRLTFASVVEIGALRLALSGQDRLDEAEAFLEGRLRNVAVEDEAFFLGAVSYSTVILGGPHSSLAKLVEQLVPQAFFRLLWLSDIYAKRTGFMVEASDQFFLAARSQDLSGVRAAARFFFDNTAPALDILITQMSLGNYPENVKTDGFHTIEPKISGYQMHARTPQSSSPLIAPYRDAYLTCPLF